MGKWYTDSPHSAALAQSSTASQPLHCLHPPASLCARAFGRSRYKRASYLPRVHSHALVPSGHLSRAPYMQRLAILCLRSTFALHPFIWVHHRTTTTMSTSAQVLPVRPRHRSFSPSWTVWTMHAPYNGTLNNLPVLPASCPVTPAPLFVILPFLHCHCYPVHCHHNGPHTPGLALVRSSCLSAGNLFAHSIAA
jgi:hypothetical protein